MTGATSVYVQVIVFGARRREIVLRTRAIRLGAARRSSARVRRPSVPYGLARSTEICEVSSDTDYHDVEF